MNKFKVLIKKIKNREKIKTLFKEMIFTFLIVLRGAIALIVYKIKNDGKKIWLIGETDISAQDNGYHFFKYIKNNHKQENCYYLINKNSPEKAKVEKIGDVIYHGTFKHLYYLFKAEKHIGTHDYRHWHYPGKSLIFSKIFQRYIKGKFIQLQHGIIHIKSERGFHYDKNKPYDLICVSSEYEKELLKNHFGHKEDVLKITGLCRYDFLEDNSKNYNDIVYMPTWRKEIRRKTRFKKSEYYIRIKEIIEDKEFCQYLREKEIKFKIYLHIKLQKFSDILKLYENDVIKIISLGEESVQNMLKNSKLLITDYSSVSLDFGYMNKPVIFYQWDFQEYVQSYDVQNSEEYQGMRFGHICSNKNELMAKIYQSIEDGFVQEKTHFKKLKIYFKYHDKKNCERIYRMIKES